MHIVPVIFYSNYTLKGTAKILTAVVLYYNTLSGTNQQILTLKMYDGYPRHFYRGIPPGDLGSSYYFIHVYSEYYQVDIFLLDIKGLAMVIHVEYCTCRLEI